MKMFTSRRIRQSRDRVLRRLAEQNQSESESWRMTLSIAIAHACHPKADFGDNGSQDNMLEKLRALPLPPCDSETALSFVKEWEEGKLTTDQLFARTWGHESDAFVLWLVEQAKI